MVFEQKGKLKMLMQDLTIYLKSGEKLSLVFEAEKADELHPQIEAFFKALSDHFDSKVSVRRSFSYRTFLPRK